MSTRRRSGRGNARDEDDAQGKVKQEAVKVEAKVNGSTNGNGSHVHVKDEQIHSLPVDGDENDASRQDEPTELERAPKKRKAQQLKADKPVTDFRSGLSEYERERLENIKRNQDLMRELDLPMLSRSVSPKVDGSHKPKPSANRSKSAAKAKQQQDVGPRRVSSRIAGIEADSEIQHKKLEQEAEQIRAEEVARRARRSEDLNLKDVIVERRQAKQDDDDEVKDLLQAEYDRAMASTSKVSSQRPGRSKPTGASVNGKDIARLKKDLEGLRIEHDWATVKVTPDRIYRMLVHPDPVKTLAFAGDKFGVVGIWDVAASEPYTDPRTDEDSLQPVVHQFQIHPRNTISDMHFSPDSANSLLTCSYDCSVRKTDLIKGISQEVVSGEENALYSNFDITTGGDVWISLNTGDVTHKDTREPQSVRRMFDLHDRKIGAISVNPSIDHLLVTSSLDSTMKLWDTRKLKASGKREAARGAFLASYKHGKSVSSAYWDPSGRHLLSTSYDDTLRVWTGESAKTFEDVSKGDLDDPASSLFEPQASIHHNNQTGRWLTLFRSRFHPSGGPHGVAHFAIGNMRHSTDIYAANGDLLAQLYDPDRITAVPAVNAFHPTLERIVCGNGSGRCVYWGPVQ